MSLEVWFPENIENSIAAVTVAKLTAAAANGWTNVEYCVGVLDTAHALALNFGIGWKSVRDKVRNAISEAQLLTLSADVALLLAPPPYDPVADPYGRGSLLTG